MHLITADLVPIENFYEIDESKGRRIALLDLYHHFSYPSNNE
jgi:hypothetical protein